MTGLLQTLMSARDGTIFCDRNLSLAQPTLADLATHYDLSAQRVSQLEASGKRRLEDLLSATFRTIAWACDEVKWRLGTMVPSSDFYANELVGAMLDEEQEHPPERGRLLLHILALQQDRDWIGRPDGPFPGNKSALDEIADEQRVIGPLEVAAEKVAALGIARRFALGWLSSDPSVRKVGNVYIRWDGTALERAGAVLAAVDDPMPLEVLLAEVTDEADGRALARRISAAFAIDADGYVSIR